MAVQRVLSQDEIDSVFKQMASNDCPQKPQASAAVYDFRRPDRIPKDQLREIHLLNDNFCRSLCGSLSAYLRAQVSVTLISVLQLSFAEFVQCFPSPSCVAVLSLRPFDGKGILELNPSLTFPMIEILLGGQAKNTLTLKREITEIERSVLDGALRIILRDLREAWTSVANFDLLLEELETEPQLVQTLSPNEAVVAVGIEVRIGESVGMMNFGVPAIVIKMLRQRFDQRWTNKSATSTAAEKQRILNLAAPSKIQVTAQLEGPTITVKDILRMQIGDTMVFEYPTTKPISVLLNGKKKFEGTLLGTSNKKAIRLAGPPMEARNAGEVAEEPTTSGVTGKREKQTQAKEGNIAGTTP